MNLPSIFKKGEVKQQQEESDNVETFVKREGVPKIIFKDEVLHVAVGQWLEILASKMRTGGIGISLISQLPADSLLQSGVAKGDLEEVDYVLGTLLKQIGIPEDETCIFDDYDEKEFGFKCHFEGVNEDAKIHLRWGTMVDDLPEMIIDYKNIVRRYEYHDAHCERPRRLTLSNYTASNPENGNKIYSFASPYNANFKVSNGNLTMDITVERPDDIEAYGDYVFRLKNDEELVEYFLDMSFPPNIADVYKKMCEIAIDSVDDYPKFSIKVEKKENLNGTDIKAVITDRMLVKKGKLCNFVLTKNGKKVGIDCQGNTTYEEDRFTLNKSNLGSIEYHLNVAYDEDINSVGTLPDHIKKAQDEVDEVRLLAKTISGKDI